MQNKSEKTAISVILPKMSLTSSGDMGGPRSGAMPFGDAEPSEAVETVRDDDPDEFGGDTGRVCGTG